MAGMKKCLSLCLLYLFILSLAAYAQRQTRTRVAQGHRDTVSLDGAWDVEDGVAADVMPQRYTHTVPVPGLTHSAVPAFKDVDDYQDRRLLYNWMVQGRSSRADFDKLGNARGTTKQTRKYFWYRKTFRAGARRNVALLKVNKAQFGIQVYVNGKLLGEHAPCFTAATFDATDAVKWNANNEVVIRVGAHPGMLPANVSAGTDQEKNRWTPGIYDSVEFEAMDNPFIASVQVAPHIADGTITVKTLLINMTDREISAPIKHEVRERVSHIVRGNTAMTTARLAAGFIGHATDAPASFDSPVNIQLGPGRSLWVEETVRIAKPHLWNPDDPFLYELTTSTPGDAVTTRFGMREFRFDTATRRAYLNGKPFFMRGSNITLHRFFEDPQSGTLPWDEAWLHKLLVTIPKEMHWNSFRFCIGPVPDRWLEIADENGLLIQNEYFVWNGGNPDSPSAWHYDADEMIAEYKEWMRDNWNHPSVVIWDATNESILPEFTDKVIPAVRGLDLSNRPWENSYNSPAGADDPVEDHQYLFHRRDFKLTDMQQMMGPLPVPNTSKSAHANILNEYGWLWLNRDGTPTLLTDKLYPELLKGKPNTTASRFALQNYLLGGETEMWRAYRHYAGVLHFVYLTSSEPGAFTSDHFEDVRTLKLNPGFEHAMEQAFNPLGVYLNFWQPTMTSGAKTLVTVMMVNDKDVSRSGTLRLRMMDASGKELAAVERPFALGALGAQSYAMWLTAPGVEGDVSLDAVAVPADDAAHTVTSHRETKLVLKKK